MLHLNVQATHGAGFGTIAGLSDLEMEESSVCDRPVNPKIKFLMCFPSAPQTLSTNHLKALMKGQVLTSAHGPCCAPESIRDTQRSKFI